ncbi:hypothetical protein ACRAWG_36420 [Methylobacterium sp. P31]
MNHTDPDHPGNPDKRIHLTIWPNSGPAESAESRDFPTLEAALKAATAVMKAQKGQPWIITAEGNILSPRWIRNQIEPADDG